MRLSPTRVVQALIILGLVGFLGYQLQQSHLAAEARSNPAEDDEAADLNFQAKQGEQVAAVVAVSSSNEPVVQRAPATELEKHYDDVPIPAGWTNTDWSGMSPEKAAVASPEEKEDSSFRKYAFNALRSNQLPLRRQLPDLRTAACKSSLYPIALPRASVIICFAEEMWSSLFRTVWSVLDRTPRHLLAEILLVNDASTATWLQSDLDAYMRDMPPIVKIVRTPTRSGLIRARTFGASHAVGEVLVFLDSHCEASTGWAEPLLARIAQNERYVICPTIDSINDRNLNYQHGGAGAVGGFHWTLDFTWIYKPLAPGRTIADPLPSPTMAGGLFAIHRNFWEHLGKYDLGMGGWGGENLELSFRVWMCGGELEIHPCSSVGHIFRGSHPYDVPGGFSETYMKNSKRLAEVWMDDYKDVYYLVRPSAQALEVGDYSDRIALRQRLQCKPFKYFMDLFFKHTKNHPKKDKYIPTNDKIAHRGQFKAGTGQCADKLGNQHHGQPIGMYGCHNEATSSINQAFIFTTDGQIRTIWDNCWDVNGQNFVQLAGCGAANIWRYESAFRHIVHVRTGLCLDATSEQRLVVSACDSTAAKSWTFSEKLNA